MKFLIDVCMSPQWVRCFKAQGYEAKHWSDVGSMNAQDHELLEWANENGFIVFTHDLDYGAILSAT